LEHDNSQDKEIINMYRDVTRGGQTSLHQFRMMRQVVNSGAVFALIIAVLYTSWNLTTQPKCLWTDTYEYYIATISNKLLPANKQHLPAINYRAGNGLIYKRSSYSIINDSQIKNNVIALQQVIINATFSFIKVFILSFALILGFWLIYGYRHRQKKVQKGAKVVDCSTLARQLKLTGNASKYKIGELPLEKGTETQHILLTGTTGSGFVDEFCKAVDKTMTTKLLSFII